MSTPDMSPSKSNPSLPRTAIDIITISHSDLKVKLLLIMVCILQQVMIPCTIVSITRGLEEWFCWVQNNHHMVQLSVCYFFNIHASTSENPISFFMECMTAFSPRDIPFVFDLIGRKLVWWIWYLSVRICAASSISEVLKMGCTWMKISTVKRMNLVSFWMIYM